MDENRAALLFVASGINDRNYARTLPEKGEIESKPYTTWILKTLEISQYNTEYLWTRNDVKSAL